MTCDAFRSALAATPAGEWPAGIRAHLAGCESCASAAVERALHDGPAVEIPPMFAADVARRVRAFEPVASRRAVAPRAGLVAAAVLIVLCAAWLVVDDLATVAPIAAILLAGGEAIVFAAWAVGGAGLRRAPWPRP